MDNQKELLEKAVIRQCQKDLARIHQSLDELCTVMEMGYGYLSDMDTGEIDKGIILGFMGVSNFISRNLNEEMDMILEHIRSIRETEETMGMEDE